MGFFSGKVPVAQGLVQAGLGFYEGRRRAEAEHRKREQEDREFGLRREAGDRAASEYGYIQKRRAEEEAYEDANLGFGTATETGGATTPQEGGATSRVSPEGAGASAERQREVSQQPVISPKTGELGYRATREPATPSPGRTVEPTGIPSPGFAGKDEGKKGTMAPRGLIEDPRAMIVQSRIDQRDAYAQMDDINTRFADYAQKSGLDPKTIARMKSDPNSVYGRQMAGVYSKLAKAERLGQGAAAQHFDQGRNAWNTALRMGNVARANELLKEHPQLSGLYGDVNLLSYNPSNGKMRYKNHLGIIIDTVMPMHSLSASDERITAIDRLDSDVEAMKQATSLEQARINFSQSIPAIIQVTREIAGLEREYANTQDPVKQKIIGNRIVNLRRGTMIERTEIMGGQAYSKDAAARAKNFTSLYSAYKRETGQDPGGDLIRMWRNITGHTQNMENDPKPSWEIEQNYPLPTLDEVQPVPQFPAPSKETKPSTPPATTAPPKSKRKRLSWDDVKPSGK